MRADGGRYAHRMQIETPDGWRAAGAEHRVLGRRLFVMDSAPGDTSRTAVLLIHGFPTAGWDWHAIWDALSVHYRLVAPDMLGFGFSEKPAGHDYTIHEQADFMAALADDLDLDGFHVLAHDYGDTVAQELLARQNARESGPQWRSLCLLNGGLFPETHRARFAQKLLQGPLGGIATHALRRGTLDRNMRTIFGPDTQPAPGMLDAFWQLMTHGNGKRNMHRLMQYIRDRRVHRERWLAALREARVPIRLINGSVDPVSGAHMVERYRELVGEGDVVALDRIGHYPQVEAPAAVAEHFLSFARQHD